MAGLCTRTYRTQEFPYPVHKNTVGSQDLKFRRLSSYNSPLITGAQSLWRVESGEWRVESGEAWAYPHPRKLTASSNTDTRKQRESESEPSELSPACVSESGVMSPAMAERLAA